MLPEEQLITLERDGTNRASTTTLEREKAKNELFFALSNHRRRFVLDYLYREGGPRNVRDIVEALAAWENDIDTSMTTSVQRKRAYVSLRQSHLPKLAEMDLIDYDASRGVVTTGERWDAIDGYLGATDSRGRYNRTVVAGLLILAMVGLGIGVLSLGVLSGLATRFPDLIRV